MAAPAKPNTDVQTFEQHAEMLAVYQLDLIAQIQHQLRTANHTLRLIEQLRGVPHRVGPELTDRQRGEVLSALAEEWIEIDAQLGAQHDFCAEFQATVNRMKTGLQRLQKSARSVRPPPTTETSSQPEG